VSRPELEVDVLGPAVVRVDGTAVAVDRPLERALLVRLALAEGTPVADRRLVPDLWGDTGVTRPVERLRVLASRLRATLGPAACALTRSPAGYALAARAEDLRAARADTDVLAATSDAAPDAAATRRAAAAAALDRWRGPALADLRAFPYADAEGERLDAWRLELLIDRLTADLALGGSAGLLPELHALTTEHPLHEGVRRLHAVALYRAGRQADALEQLAMLRRRLADDLGVDPDPQTVDLELRLLRHDPQLAGPTRRPAGPPADPAAQSVTAGPARAAVRGTATFVGRDGELAALVARLGQAGLVTLLGGPGAGKSRLATEAAGIIAPERRTVVVELAPMRPGTVPLADAVAAAAGVETAAADAVLGCAGALAGALLVLDNAEHLVEEVRELVVALRRQTPGLTVLVTSQRPLLLTDEERHRVAPLAPAAAATLFRQHCTAAAGAPPDTAAADTDIADTAAVETICAGVDHLPLGIELAAGLTRTMSVAQLAERIPDRLRLLVGGHRDAGHRHISLRAALTWSHELLAPRERTVLRRVAVFAGGFGLEAAEQVVADDAVEVGEVAPALADLVGRCLVGVVRTETGGAPRFSLLETVRALAHDRLGAAGELDAVRARHLDWCLERVRVADRAGTAVAEWPDIVQAVALAPGTGRAGPGLRLALGVHREWFARGQFGEARRNLAALVGSAGADPIEQCRAMLGHCAASVLMGRLDEAGELLARTAELAAGVDPDLELTVLLNRGVVAIHRNRLPEAFEVLQAGRRLADRTGDEHARRQIAEALALAHVLCGDGAAANDAYREAPQVREGRPDGHVLARMVAGLRPEAAHEVLGGLVTYMAAVNVRLCERWRAVSRAALADADLRAACDELERRNRLGNRSTVALLAQRGVLRSDRPVDELGDLLWMLVHLDTHHRLAVQAGWGVQRYTEWLRSSAVDLLLTGPATKAQP